MEDILIKPSKLINGRELKVGGYKHVLVTIVSAVLSQNKTTTLYNVPNIFDTKQIILLLKNMGKRVDYNAEQNTLKIYKSEIINADIPDTLSNPIHGSIYLFIGLLITNKYASLGNTGGCKIGNEKGKSSRPEQHFFEVMKRFGIDTIIENEERRFSKYNKLKKVNIDIAQFTGDNSISSNLHSGATKAALLCTLGLKEGRVVIKNPYLKPDVTELIKFMKLLGFKIKVEEKMITIECGVSDLEEYEFTIMSDIAEIISFICLAIFNKIDLFLKFEDIQKVKIGLNTEFKILESMDVPLKWEKNGLAILGKLTNQINPYSITVTSSSIFSDSQPFFAILGLMGNQKSEIIEGIWTSRFGYAREAIGLGYPFKIKKNKLSVYPWDEENNSNLVSELHANDLRAAFALLILSVKLKKKIVINDFYHIHRGYSDVYDKLRSLGICIQIIK